MCKKQTSISFIFAQPKPSQPRPNPVVLKVNLVRVSIFIRPSTLLHPIQLYSTLISLTGPTNCQSEGWSELDFYSPLQAQAQTQAQAQAPQKVSRSNSTQLNSSESNSTKLNPTTLSHTDPHQAIFDHIQQPTLIHTDPHWATVTHTKSY